MAYDALRRIMPIAGWPEERAREVEISVGADPVLPTRFRIGPRGLLREGPSDIITDGAAPDRHLTTGPAARR